MFGKKIFCFLPMVLANRKRIRCFLKIEFIKEVVGWFILILS